MGTRSGSPLGDMSGKIGTIVLSKWKGISVVKGLPGKTKKVSLKQQSQRTLFTTVMNFLSGANEVIKLGYQLPNKSKVSEMNMATTYHILNAVRGEYPDYSFDLSKLKFSSPIRSTENGWNAEFTGSKDFPVSVSWEMNPFPKKVTRWDDQAVIVLYDTKKFVVFKNAERRELNFLIPNSDHFYGRDLFCWLFFISADGKFVSETEYLGMIKMV